MVFSLFIPIMIIRTPKIRDNHIHIMFNFLVITISIYVPTTKNKDSLRKFNSQAQKLPKGLNDSNMARIGLEMDPETLSNCCRNYTGTKQGLVEVRSTPQLLWILSSSFGTQSRTQHFRRNSNRTPNEWETNFGMRLCSVANNVDEQCRWKTVPMNSMDEQCIFIFLE